MERGKFVVATSEAEYPQTRIIGRNQERALDTYVNLSWLLSQLDCSVKYNLMTRHREIIIKDYNISIEDKENAALNAIIHLATINLMPIKLIDSHLDTISHQNMYHPIVECIKNEPWDGVSRLDKFIATLVTDYIDAPHIIRTWMCAAMAAAHSAKGFANQGVLVLQGPQKVGKTTWVENLDPIGCGAIKTGAFLDPTNKDSVYHLAQYWLAELAEVEAIFKKSEIGRLKAFITQHMDDLRLPYARKYVSLPRRSSYIATVNESNYLTDTTGNRRWWTIPVNSIQRLDINMQQVWAEVYVLWKNGHETSLNDDNQASIDELNTDFMRHEPMRDLLHDYYDWETPGRRELSAAAILQEIGYDRATTGDAMKLATLLKELNGEGSFKKNGKRLNRIPEKKVTMYR